MLLYTVNGNNGKPIPEPHPNGETLPSVRLETSPDYFEALTKPFSLLLPARPAYAASRRRLLLGAIGVVAILAALGSVLLHRKAARMKSGLLAPSAHRLWVAHCYPISGEKPTNQPTAITTDAAGNIYITGFVQTPHHDVDFLTFKYDPYGKLLWRARYNGPGNDVDRARSIAVDQQGNVYVTGESDNGKGNGLTRLAGLDWATIKYDKNGNPSPTWPDVGFGVGVRRYNGPGDGEDWPYKLCVDGQGNVYVAGYSDARLAHNRLLHEWTLVKYDPMGHRVYAIREHPAVEYLSAVAQDMVIDPAGNIYVAGYWDIGYPGLARAVATVIKYAPDGEHIWRKTYPGKGAGNTDLSYITLDGAGNVYVAGEQYDGSHDNNGTLDDWVTLKYDANGNELWEPRVFDNNHQEDLSKHLAVDAMGDACIVGSSGPIDVSRYVSVRYDPNGNLSWTRFYNL